MCNLFIFHFHNHLIEQTKLFLLCVIELIFLGVVQHGIILLANEKRAPESSGLCGALSAFLSKVKSACSEPQH